MRGAKGHLGLVKQTAFGTAVTTGFTFLPILEESIAETWEQVENKAIRGVLGRYPSRQGLKTFGGNVAFEPQPNALGHVLRALFGAPTSSQPDGVGNPTVYQHVYKLAQSDFAAGCPTPPYTMRVHRDLSQGFQFLDAVVNSLALAFGTDEKVLKATMGVLAKDQSRVATPDTPSYESNEAWLWKQAAIKVATTIAGLDGASAYNDLESAEWSYDNKLKGKALLNATDLIARYEREDLPEQKLTLKVDPADDTEFNKFVAGTDQALEIKFTGALISGTYYYELRLRFPKVRYTAYPITMGGPGPVIVTANADAFYSSADGWDVEVRLINTQTSY